MIVLNFHSFVYKVRKTVLLASLSFYILVPIKALTILNCPLSKSEVCINEDMQQTFLVCAAKDFWPVINLQWLHISLKGPTPVLTNSTTTFNESSLLYSSTSTLEYFPESFSYQYFTCIATGTAAHKVSNNSIIIEGTIPFEEAPPEHVHVKSGSDLKLNCPLYNLPFGQLKVKYRNGTNKVINTINSYCENNGACADSDSRVTLLKNVDFVDEGSYQCISSNGRIARSSRTDVTTISKYHQLRLNHINFNYERFC